MLWTAFAPNPAIACDARRHCQMKMTMSTDCCLPIPEFLRILQLDRERRRIDEDILRQSETGWVTGTTEKNDSELQLDSLGLHITSSYQQMPVNARETSALESGWMQNVEMLKLRNQEQGSSKVHHVYGSVSTLQSRTGHHRHMIIHQRFSSFPPNTRPTFAHLMKSATVQL